MSSLLRPSDTFAALRHDEFVVTQHKVWFNTATYGPLPASNLKAQLGLLEEMSVGGGAKGIGHWWEGAAEVRAKVGALIGCDADDVALLHSTGEGLSLVSLGLDWHPGDEVVLYDQEFPSGVYPWLALEERRRDEVRARRGSLPLRRRRRRSGALRSHPRGVHEPCQLLSRFPGTHRRDSRSCAERAGFGSSSMPCKVWERCESTSDRWAPTLSPPTATRASALATASASATCRPRCGTC